MTRITTRLIPLTILSLILAGGTALAEATPYERSSSHEREGTLTEEEIERVDICDSETYVGFTRTYVCRDNSTWTVSYLCADGELTVCAESGSCDGSGIKGTREERAMSVAELGCGTSSHYQHQETRDRDVENRDDTEEEVIRQTREESHAHTSSSAKGGVTAGKNPTGSWFKVGTVLPEEFYTEFLEPISVTYLKGKNALEVKWAIVRTQGRTTCVVGWESNDCQTEVFEFDYEPVGTEIVPVGEWKEKPWQPKGVIKRMMLAPNKG